MIKPLLKIVSAAANMLAMFIAAALSVTIVPFISLLIGLWLGTVAEWLAGNMLLVDPLPELMATIFFIASALIMLINLQLKKRRQ